MKYFYYCVNIFTKIPDGTMVPIQKSGVEPVPNSVDTEEKAIDYFTRQGIINECGGYEFLELTKI